MIHERKNYSYLDFIKIKNVCFVTGMQDNEKKKKPQTERKSLQNTYLINVTQNIKKLLQRNKKTI